MRWKANSRRDCLLILGFEFCLTLAVLLASGCWSHEQSETVYVPEVDRLYFVSPGDIITDANGLPKAKIPYKGILMSNQAYVELLAPPTQN
jgi:hypothetical protein